MPPFNTFLGLVLLAITCPLVSAGFHIAYPLASNKSRILPPKYAAASNESRIAPSKYATHRSHVVAHGRRLESFHPPSTFKTFGDGIDQPPPLGINSTNIRFQSGFSEGPDTYAYVRQSHGGVPFANAVVSVALHNSRIVAFGSSFVEITNIAASTPSLDVWSVIPNAENALNGTFNGHNPTLEYLVQSDGSISLTHVVQIQNDDTGTWFEAFMDAHSGDILSVTDFVARASYKVVPIWEGDFFSGLATLTNPQDTSSSSLGWHDNGTTTTTSTDGNNVIAFKMNQHRWTRRKEAVTTFETRPGLVFDYTYVDTLSPKLEQNIDAARTNAFYVINTMHDITYKYGFTEKSFNFQANNFGKGGLGNDRIRVHVQDGSRTNGASFDTPPDGQSGICKLHLWDKTSPQRDSAMDNGMIIHEFTHGLTSRMVGGGTARCLGTTEAGGLSEGCDALYSRWAQQKRIPLGSSLLDYVAGRYFTNSIAGSRTRPYSTSTITNPFRYSTISTTYDRYDIGEVWANILHNVYAALVKKYGFSERAKTDPTAFKGNVIFMHLFIDALSIVPCNPTFVNARDAWIQADRNRYGGVSECLLWVVFASKGLGVGARYFEDDSSVPHTCTGKI
ncbi:Fungalysin metallopeptidase-domain-containing protein [Infundibulicybe gibba]|nr:Fungalysin metallopeptidase-domain-containing protein [Infundibulicybe gibba]